MENKIQIKPYISIYHQQVLNLILSIQQNEFQIPLTLDDQPDLKDITEHYQKGNGNFWVAMDQEQVIGTISLMDLGNYQAALRKLFVQKEYRGKEKYASKLLFETMLNWAKTKNLCEVYLSSHQKYLAAHRFYEKNGGVEITREELPKEFPYISLDGKFYKLIL